MNAPDPCSDFLINPNFQGIDILVVLPFNADDSRIGHSIYRSSKRERVLCYDQWKKLLINQLKVI